MQVSDTYLREELRQNAHAPLAQHVVEEGAHGVLDLLGGEDAVALGRVVHAVARPGKTLQRAVVVLGLEAEVSLHHDDDERLAQHWVIAQAVDVPLDKCKLLFGLCYGNNVSK